VTDDNLQPQERFGADDPQLPDRRFPVKALVIDDSRAMRMVIRRILTAEGLEVDEAGDGLEALQVLTDQPLPDVCLIDWNMPNMDGLEFIREVRKRDEWRGLTLMMVTTESESDQIVRALAAGAHEYIMKPFTPEALSEKLRLFGLLEAS
jgi:two-component system, chemotaxis family, chemotaxis protein CheY